MSELDLVRGFLEAMSGIEAGLALDTLAARRLAGLSPEMAARTLDQLIARREKGPSDRRVVNACCRALVWGAPDFPDERRGAIRAAALALGLGAVVALFTEASPAMSPDPDARRPDSEVGSLTLGHRKQFARTETDPDRITRFAVDDDPTVIRNLLLNPRVTEPLVVRIAARRPVPGEVLRELAFSRRWSARRTVRRALALNPYTPPVVVNPLLADLTIADLEEVAQSMVLHPAVRAGARSLLEARRRS